MFDSIKKLSWYQLIVALLLIFGTIFSVYTPDLFVFKMGARFAPQFTFLCLALGFLFLFTRSTNLMFVSFSACAMMCIFLKSSFLNAEQAAFYPKPNGQPNFKVAHFNVGLSGQAPPETVGNILDTQADIITIQELTLDWNMFLQSGLASTYPYSKSIVRLDFRGLAIYSKFPLTEVDTFHFGESPNLYGKIQIADNQEDIHFMYANTEPPVSQAAYQKIRQHLNQTATRLQAINAPTLALGSYNVVPWSPEMKKFRTQTKLSNGRRDFTRLLQVPTEHILHSKNVECVNFQSIYDDSGSYIGVMGQFQYK